MSKITDIVIEDLGIVELPEEIDSIVVQKMQEAEADL